MAAVYVQAGVAGLCMGFMVGGLVHGLTAWFQR